DGTGEVADGLDGADTLSGAGGGDTLTGGEGNDRILPGDDYVADALSGGNGIDVIDYSNIRENGVLFSGFGGTVQRTSVAGRDTFSGFEQFEGSAAGDYIDIATSTISVAWGGAGDDLFIANGGRTVWGGAGRDFFYGANNSFTIADFDITSDYFFNTTIASIAISGADTLLTSTQGGVIRIVGVTGYTLAQWQARQSTGNFTAAGDANDTLNGTAGGDYLWDGGGTNTLNGFAGDDSLVGGAGDDTLNGGDNNDRLAGGSGTNTLNGGLGDDYLIGGSGNDAFNGGDGVDTASFEQASAGVTAVVNLNGATGQGVDSYSSIENRS